ncbi:PAS domain S-box-containing protein [Rhodoligotrophos appendicifer]|uniref:PAS domain-containing protein n=1 Tax=Rhodoligotrophos appendicifer TaxID=987056 RepID=UPI001184757D|nr:PAS domain-containing protein [Rhodoligotrophos appendicifer]
MVRAVVGVCERDRLATLAEHDVEGLTEDDGLDDIAAHAAALCGTPISLVSLVKEHQQVFPGKLGLEARETSREVSFCVHAMSGPEIMVIPDARRDERFTDNILVTGAPHIRFYAGVPLVSEEGIPLGSLCVIDTSPREGLTALQRQGLTLLAENVMLRLHARRTAKRHTSAQRNVALALSESEQRFRILADTMPQMVWSTLPDGYHDYYNARWYAFTGMVEGTTDGEGWNGMFHADDQDRAWTIWKRSLETGEPYEIEYRLRHHSGVYRWVLGRALPMRDATGDITRWFGTCTDIHEHRLLLEQREIISQELSHRIKNIFSVISGLITFTAQAHPPIKPVADDLRLRIMALSRAHDFVRPHSAASRPAAQQTSLHRLLEQILQPYQDTEKARITIRGYDPEIDDRSATPFALFFHELATNAAKYGALSRLEGTIEIAVEDDDDTVRLTWRELGGPELAVSPDYRGFGSRLLELSGKSQLGGSLERSWLPSGLEATLAIPKTSLRIAAAG